MQTVNRLVVVGGRAAVPESKLAGFSVETRLWGKDRLETMRAVIDWADNRPAESATGHAGLSVAPESSTTGYQRYDHHSQACATTTVGFYTGLPFSDGGGCDVDHVVSLAEAWRSGAHAWPDSRFRYFAQDPTNLVASLSCVNRSKGDRDASKWPAAVGSGDCEGLTATMSGCDGFRSITVTVKRKWGLGVDAAESKALDGWTARCSGLPAQHQRSASGSQQDDEESDDDDEPVRTGSCTHWHAGAPKHTHVHYSDGTVSGHRHQPSSSTKCGYLWQ